MTIDKGNIRELEGNEFLSITCFVRSDQWRDNALEPAREYFAPPSRQRTPPNLATEAAKLEGARFYSSALLPAEIRTDQRRPRTGQLPAFLMRSATNISRAAIGCIL